MNSEEVLEVEWKGLPGLRRDGRRRSLAAHGGRGLPRLRGRGWGAGWGGGGPAGSAVPGLRPGKTGEKSRFQNEAGR